MNKSVPLSCVAEINPKGPVAGAIDPEDECDFVPMASVLEDGTMIVQERRPYRKVAKGYTAFMSGDVLLAKITPCFENGKIALAKTTSKFAFGSTEFHVIRGHREELDQRYLLYFLRLASVRVDGENKMTGSAGQKRVPRSFLEQLEIPLPPIEEQRRIAAILDKADAIRRKREQALDLADEFLKTVFLEMFGNPLRPKEGLEVSDIAAECNLYAGNSLPKGEEFRGQKEGILLAKVSDMNSPENITEIKSAKLWAEDDGKIRQSIIAPSGAIVFPKRGGAISTNKKRVLVRKAVLDPNLMGVSPKPTSRISSEYLRAWFGFIDLVTISSGSAVPQLNKKDLDPLPIAVPSPDALSAYSNISRRNSELRLRLDMALKLADDAFHALSQRAFHGEL